MIVPLSPDLRHLEENTNLRTPDGGKSSEVERVRNRRTEKIRKVDLQMWVSADGSWSECHHNGWITFLLPE
jgi:hypothetical protein